MGQGSRSDKTRRWTAAFWRHGKRRGKLARAYATYRRLVGRMAHPTDMVDAEEFWKRRRR